MTDNMMPELTLEPTAAAEAVPQLTLEPSFEYFFNEF